MVRRGEFEIAAPESAAFGADAVGKAPAYLATVTAVGRLVALDDLSGDGNAALVTRP